MKECCICYNKKSIINFSCKHAMFFFGFLKITKVECPYCRKNLKKEIPKKIINIIKQNNTLDSNNRNTDVSITDYYYDWTEINTDDITIERYNRYIWPHTPNNTIEEEIFPTEIEEEIYPSICN